MLEATIRLNGIDDSVYEAYEGDSMAWWQLRAESDHVAL